MGSYTELLVRWWRLAEWALLEAAVVVRHHSYVLVPGTDCAIILI